MNPGQAVLHKMRQAWLTSTLNQRALTAIVVIGAAVSVAVFTTWLRHDSMTVLYSGLDAEQASAAVDHVRDQGISVEVRDGGRTVLVPLRDVDRLRMELAMEGIGGDGVRGWDLFDERVVGETDFSRNVRLKRAVEGELARSIASISQVERARVHISMPKESVFLRDRRNPTASVLLSLRGRHAPGAPQIEGVQHLVASAVDGLQPEQVAVIDAASGHVLSSGASDTLAGASDGQLRLRKDVERYLASKASDLLADVLGPGRSVVRVNADLDFGQLERSTETYDPQTVVRSEQTDQTSDTTGGAGATTTITNYEVPRTVETVLKNGSVLQRLTVAVAVDGARREQAASGSEVYTPRSTEELAQIERMVASAVGLVPTRGDAIEVVNMPFDVPQVSPVTFSWVDHPLVQQAPAWVGLLLMLLVAAIVLVIVARTFARVWREAPPVRAARVPSGPDAGGRSPEVRGVADWAQGEPDEVATVLEAFATRED